MSKQTKFELGPIFQTIFTGKGKSPLSLKDDILSKIMVMPSPLIVFYKLTRTRLSRWYLVCKFPIQHLANLNCFGGRNGTGYVGCSSGQIGPRFHATLRTLALKSILSLVFCNLPRVFILTCNWNGNHFPWSNNFLHIWSGDQQVGQICITFIRGGANLSLSTKI